MITSHLPTHSSREILIISGSLTTVDPGNIYETLSSCVKDRIRISLVALAAEMKICRELCEKTGGAPHFFFPFSFDPKTAEPAQKNQKQRRTRLCRNFMRPGTFGVAMDQGHFKDLLFELIPPPAQQNTPGAGAGAGKMSADLMMMGFPQRLPDTAPAALCVCHAQMRAAGFLCPRCGARLCDAPTDCDVCGLMIVSSPHLARSYHHLFPVKPYSAV
jgi:transcription initiation factor TFIIH subunit 2